jgi:hypothetical protein
MKAGTVTGIGRPSADAGGFGLVVMLALLAAGTMAKLFTRAFSGPAAPGWASWLDVVIAGVAALFLARAWLMQPVRAVAWLTWKAAFRFRLFWALGGLLLGAVVLLPVLLKDDGTARGFTQILLTYNLGVIAALLGLATVWLACGTLARDIEDGSMMVVAVKPVARWQVWLGKWFGLLLLNAALLAASGGSVYGLLQWRAGRMEHAAGRALAEGRTNEAARVQRELAVLRNEIFVARGSLREPAPDIEAEVQRLRAQAPGWEALGRDEQEQTLQQLRERVKAIHQVVPPNYERRWTLDLGPLRALVRDQPMFIRTKFFAAQTNASGAYVGLWRIGPPESPKATSYPQSLAAEAFHEIQIQPNLFDDDGRLLISFINRNDVTLIFPLEDGLEVLYREGGFSLNFMRGLGIVLCWLALLAALGLAAASLLSFPVAAFFALSLLVVALSSGTLASVVSEGTITGVNHESGAGGTWIDLMMIPLFKAILSVVNTAANFSPIDALSTGRSITWFALADAVAQVVVLLGGVLAALGAVLLTRRELAAAHATA